MSTDSFLQREIHLGSFPGASYAIGTVDGIESEGALGHAVAVPLRIASTTDTLYDCASLTKPLVTGMLLLQLVAEGRVALEDVHRGYSFRELLTHTTGLRPWLPLYAFDDPMREIERQGPRGKRGTPVYSDLNFFLLHEALEGMLGDYVTAASTRIFGPLGLRDACFRPAAALRPRIAATEWGQRYERKMCAELGFAFGGFREGLIWGETHDGNSFAAGGTRGNAGLFATARDIFRIVQAFARGELVPAEVVTVATRAHAGDRGLGWQVGYPGASAAAWGHTGFTGTSVSVNGSAIRVLLTNRVHPCAAPIAMQKIRARFHAL